ncbi:phosphatase PAP2 family protein [Nocardioides sp.]|uniref:phosphatase PAP2 family protein n=1 Tax=Nocardioides sp. TaxID=35761 RepID=UPI0031FEB22E|nr:phosphoesterase, PA-phosphatase related protein [Nocardioides sp.]
MSAPRSRTATATLVVVAWVAVLGVVLVVGWLITHPLRSSVDPWDNDVSRWFAGQRTGSLNTPAEVGTFLGETVVGMSVALVAALGFSWWQRSFLPAIFFALLTAGIGGFYFVATHLESRRRPPVRILDPGLVPDASYPSGHVATATAAYGGIVVLAWVCAWSARRWVWVLLALPAFVLLARLYQGAHHLTDVLTSVVYTAVWMSVLARLLLCHAVGHDPAHGDSGGRAGPAPRGGGLRGR